MNNINKPWLPKIDVLFKKNGNIKAKNDLITVCITSFNYSDYIEEALDSVYNQTYKNVALVVVDDCSSDDSTQVIEDWMQKHASRFNFVKLIRHQRNQGPSAARNTAFIHADDSKYIFVMDADNEIFPTALEKLYPALVENDFDAVYAQIEKFGDEKSLGSADIWDPEEMAKGNYVDVMCLMKKKAWEIVDGYSHIDEGWEDYDFWLKFIDKNLKVGYLPEILFRYRVHNKSRTSKEAYVVHDNLKLIMSFRHPYL